MLSIDYITEEPAWFTTTRVYGYYAVWKIRGRLRCVIRRGGENLVIHDIGIGWFSLEVEMAKC